MVVSVMLVIGMTADASEKPRFASLKYDQAYIQTVFETYPLETAIQTLINREMPPLLIIEEAHRLGFPDNRITEAFYQSGLPESHVIFVTMQSHMSPKKVLQSLESLNVEPQRVLELLITHKADINRILATCDHILERGYTKAELLKILGDAGADQDMILMAAMTFNIPPATVLEAQIVIHDEIEAFGYVYNRHSLPRPALLAVGIARIHNDSGKGRDVISPKTP